MHSKMELEPWEALDLDDSDLPSLLRPCKRRRSTSPAAAAAAAVSQSPSSHPPAVNCTEQLQQQPPPSTSGRRTIPGPAGAVQAAMLRKNIDCENQNLKISNRLEDGGEEINGNRHNNGVISTQDYIRRAMDDTAEFDEDFSRHPWLSALRFLGAEDGVLQSMPISSIKKCLSAGKVDQVVAVIKSCTPNGLGGLMVLLKDPTGTVGASIHHKVLAESEFGKNLTIGAVIVLKEVSIFAPLRSAHYLNITLRNLVQVFRQNSSSTSKLSDAAYPTKYADLGIEHSGRNRTAEKMSTMHNATMESIEKRQNTRKAESLQNVSVIQKQNLFSGGAQFNNKASINKNAAETVNIVISQGSSYEIPEDVNQTRICGDDQEFMTVSDEGAKEDSSESLLNGAKNMTDSIWKTTCEENSGINEVQMQRQPQVLKASLPQWTDEQLDELFAGDDDDGALF